MSSGRGRVTIDRAISCSPNSAPSTPSWEAWSRQLHLPGLAGHQGVVPPATRAHRGCPGWAVTHSWQASGLVLLRSGSVMD